MTPPGSQVRRILFLEMLGGFGDVLLALPAISALANAYPAAELTVATLPPGDELLAGEPAVTTVVCAPPAATGPWLREHLASVAYDLAVSTTMHSGIDAILSTAVPHAVTNLWRRPPADELVDRRYLLLLVADGVLPPASLTTPLALTLTPAELASGRALLDVTLGHGSGSASAPTAAGPLLALPLAGMPVKRWPSASWRRLLAEAGRPALTVHSAAGLLPEARPLPELGLRALASVAAAVGERGGVAVGADTGPVRLAAAAGCPAVGLFGPTLATRYGLPPARTVDLQGLPGCELRRPTAITEQVCWWSAACPLDPAGPACMADLSVEAVLAALHAVAAGC